MQKYSRYQRRHNYFVLSNGMEFLKFAPDGVSFGFVPELERANAFDHKKAQILQKVLTELDLSIRMVKRLKGKFITI